MGKHISWLQKRSDRTRKRGMEGIALMECKSFPEDIASYWIVKMAMKNHTYEVDNVVRQIYKT